MIKDAERFADDDKKLKEKVDAKNELESYVYSLKNQVSDKEKLGGKLSDEDKETITEAVEESIKWLESNGDADVEELKEAKKKLEEKVNPITSKLYGDAGGPGGPGGPSGGSRRDEDDEL